MLISSDEAMSALPRHSVKLREQCNPGPLRELFPPGPLRRKFLPGSLTGQTLPGQATLLTFTCEYAFGYTWPEILKCT